MNAAGWYTDPLDERFLRYWDGAEWTESVQSVQANPQYGDTPATHPVSVPDEVEEYQAILVEPDPPATPQIADDFPAAPITPPLVEYPSDYLAAPSSQQAPDNTWTSFPGQWPVAEHQDSPADPAHPAGRTRDKDWNFDTDYPGGPSQPPVGSTDPAYSAGPDGPSQPPVGSTDPAYSVEPSAWPPQVNPMPQNTPWPNVVGQSNSWPVVTPVPSSGQITNMAPVNKNSRMPEWLVNGFATVKENANKKTLSIAGGVLLLFIIAIVVFRPHSPSLVSADGTLVRMSINSPYGKKVDLVVRNKAYAIIGSGMCGIMTQDQVDETVRFVKDFKKAATPTKDGRVALGQNSIVAIQYNNPPTKWYYSTSSTAGNIPKIILFAQSFNSGTLPTSNPICQIRG